jgi:hypothetical protein
VSREVLAEDQDKPRLRGRYLYRPKAHVLFNTSTNLTSAEMERLRSEAKARNLSMSALLTLILANITTDGLFNAVIGDPGEERTCS